MGSGAGQSCPPILLEVVILPITVVGGIANEVLRLASSMYKSKLSCANVTS